jgi:replication factor C small subunit
MTNDTNLPWVEKYRPKTLDDVVGHKQIIERLKKYSDDKNLPNMIFAGSAGTGKTTSAIAIAKALYSDNYERNFLELNASDDRGIEVVRKTIKDFARTLPLDAEYKIIFLDEADALTQDAQQALRRTMEKYTKTCRFILSCNYSSKIIEPIQSRCVVFRFKPLEKLDVVERIKHVAKLENIKIDSKALDSIFYVSLGDMRKAVNILQACSVLNSSIEEKDVFNISARARPEEVKQMVLLAKDGKFKEARDLLYKLLYDYGMSGEDIVNQTYREVVDFSEDILDSKQKIKLIEVLGEINFRISEGSNDRLQIEAMLALFNMK